MSDTARDVIARVELVDFLVQYGGRCRDCADEDGFCPQTGIGCGQRRKAVEFVLGALEYGSKHSFAAGYRILGPDELDPWTLERAELACFHQQSKAKIKGEWDRGNDSAVNGCIAAIRSLKGGRNA